MKEQVSLITGGASGIGLEIAKTLAREESVVVIADLNGDLAQECAEQLIQEGFKAIGVRCDVAEEADVEACIEYIKTTYGRLDILVNNAGLQHIAPIEEFPSEKFEHMLRVMLMAPFYSIKHVFPLMKAQHYGRIINMASINGLVGFAGKAAYNSAKHGLIGLTKVAALEGADYGITVNAVCPGYVGTPLVRNQLDDLARERNVAVESVLEEVIYPLVPQKRLLEVDEIAHYVSFLVSEKAKGITGQAVVIDGGYTIQ